MKPVRVGIIGCGVMGKMHANCYRALSDMAQVVGVADVRREEAAAVAQLTGARIYDSAEELLGDSHIDAVDICVPTFLHKKYVVQAAQAKKQILCEKPAALTMADVHEMVAAARRARVRLMFGMVIRFWPEYQALADIVTEKRFGRLTTLVCTRLASPPTYGWENWFADPRRSGGAALDLHIHDVDFICWVLGAPRGLTARARRTREGLVHIMAVYDYPGMVVAAEGGWDQDPAAGFDMGFRATFEDGTTLEYHSRTGTFKQYHRGAVSDVSVPRYNAHSDVGGNISDLGGYYNEIRYWCTCLRDSQPCDRVSLESVLRSHEVVFNEIRSATRAAERGKR